MSTRSVSASTVIEAPAATIFAILADPRQHARIDGSGSVRGLATGPERLTLGARFGMQMKLGAPYTIANTVVEFEEDRLIAWRHFGLHRWRYELESVDAGTRVTETWDASRYPTPAWWALSALHFPARNQAGIDGTLVQLAQAADEDTRRTN